MTQELINVALSFIKAYFKLRLRILYDVTHGIIMALLHNMVSSCPRESIGTVAIMKNV